MLAFFAPLLTALVAVRCLAVPFINVTETVDASITELVSRATSPGQGTSNGYFYSYWTDGGGTVVYDNGGSGAYTTQWSNVGNFVAGKGWKPGSARQAIISMIFSFFLT